MDQQDIALIGLGVMGQNLVLNMDRHGFAVSVFNRTRAVTERFAAERAQGTAVRPFFGLKDLVASLKRPRKIVLMVKAGDAVDAVIGEVLPFLKPDDILLDGGNSHFGDTTRRFEQLAARGVRFLGVGISGGEEGALNGPSIMPGGPREAYDQVAPILEAIAAKAPDGSPCVAYLGPRGAGHYVKMVHNGIEYAVLQLIAETFDLFHRDLRVPTPELAETFATWNKGELASYLIEITAEVLKRKDPETGQPLVDVILDEAEQKGTGRWTAQEALDLGIPIPTISAAVEARGLSSLKGERVTASAMLEGRPLRQRSGIQPALQDAPQALYASILCAYAQGMALLRAASERYQFGLDLAEISRIWQAGCIIRAAMLSDIRRAFTQQPGLPNLLLAPQFGKALTDRQPAWRRMVRRFLEAGLPCPAASASLAYFDAYRSELLPANLIQGLRDYFGAHTYRRLDREGVFHTRWTK